jgi:hypothetical protein
MDVEPGPNSAIDPVLLVLSNQNTNTTSPAPARLGQRECNPHESKMVDTLYIRVRQHQLTHFRKATLDRYEHVVPTVNEVSSTTT